MSASESAARAALLTALPVTVREGIEERFNAVREARPPADFCDALGELQHYLDALVDADIIPFDLRVAIIEPIGDAWSVARDQLQKKLQLPTPTPASAAMLDADNQGDVEELMLDILRVVGPVSERDALAQLLGRLGKRLLEGNPSARAQLQGVLQGIWVTGLLSDRDHESLSQRIIDLAERISMMWDANKVSSLEIKCHPEQSGSGLVRPLEPPMIAACKAAIREEISKVTIEINDLRFQVRMTLYSHGSGVFRPFEGRCEALG